MVAEQFSGQFSFLNGCWAILPAMTFLKEEDAENSDGFEKDASKARISFRNLNLQIFKYPIQWKYTETIMFLYSVRRGHHSDLHMTNRNLRSSRQLWISAHPSFLPGPGRDLGEELRNSWIFLRLTTTWCHPDIFFTQHNHKKPPKTQKCDTKITVPGKENFCFCMIWCVFLSSLFGIGVTASQELKRRINQW